MEHVSQYLSHLKNDQPNQEHLVSNDVLKDLINQHEIEMKHNENLKNAMDALNYKTNSL